MEPWRVNQLIFTVIFAQFTLLDIVKAAFPA